MDYGSRPFKCRYRPFRDSDAEVEIEWFPAAPGALPLGLQSCITNPFWERDQFEYSDGELPLSTVEPTGKPVVRPGTGRGHVCGSAEDFREGGKYEPEEPPVEYGAQGLPTCCGAPVVAGGVYRDGGTVGVVSPVVPGTTCAGATPIPVGEWLEVSILPGATWWLSFDKFLPTVEVWTLTTDGPSNPALGSVLSGVCPSPSFVDFNQVPRVLPFTRGPLAPILFVSGVRLPLEPPTTFRVRVDPP